MTIQTLEEKVQKTATQTANTVKDWTGGVAARASSVLDEAKTAVGDAGAFIEDAALEAGSRPLKSASRHMPRVRKWPTPLRAGSRNNRSRHCWLLGQLASPSDICSRGAEAASAVARI